MPGQFAKNFTAILDRLSVVLDQVDRDAADRLVDMLLNAPALFLAGAGRSGLLIRCAAMRLMHLGLPVHLVGDTLAPAIVRGDLLLIASGSGETGGLVAMARKAKGLGAAVAVVTASPASTLAGAADLALVLNASASANPDAAATHPMGSLFEESMFLFLEAAVLELMRKTGMTSETMFTRHANLE